MWCKVLFNSTPFIIFLCVVLILIWLIRKRDYQYTILLLASYYFYYFSTGLFLLSLLLFTSSLDFYTGRKVYEAKDKKIKRKFLILSLIGNLGTLAFFKYTNFAIDSVNDLLILFGFNSQLPVLNIILPIGISFFTFQTMSYTLDIYFEKLKPVDSFLRFMLYVAFFPQLVAGPILRAADFLPQLGKNILFSYTNLKFGLTLVGWGIVKKVVFADNIAPLVNVIFESPTELNSFLIILGAIGFGIQIYCDFSGYSDIAIGVAKTFGFTLPLNFNKPYFSKNPAEFWKRWHISLSTWLKDYLYIPLGGNRKGERRTNFNLMATMISEGLWHGASWNFVIWGAYQGILLTLHKFFSRIKSISGIFIFKGIGALIITQYFVFLGWLIFRIRDVSDLWYSIKKFILIDFSLNGLSILEANKLSLIFILIFLYVHYISYKNKDIIERIKSLELRYWFVYVVIIVLLLLLFAPSKTSEFIYFQF